MKNKIALVLVVAVIIGAIVYLESGKVDTSGESDGSSTIVQDAMSSSERADEVAKKESKYGRAKEISTPDVFLNVDSINIEDNIGKKVILVDFWTYSCINCQRTLPYLNSWHEKYADDGLLILGLHTPEFEFEKELGNVQRAVDKWKIKYPVILDNDFSTWRAYENRYWPRKYIIDIDGFIVYDHIGEGAYEETEKVIVDLLNERNRVLGESAISMDKSEPVGVTLVDFAKERTPEIYLGSARVEYLANLPSKDCIGVACDFVAPSKLAPNTFALVGKWQINEEHALMISKTGSIVIAFTGQKVNLVAGSSTDSPIKTNIYLDGEHKGTVSFDSYDLYNLMDLSLHGSHILEISPTSPGLQAFAFTFG